MAVFEGARLRTTALPAADAVARPRAGVAATDQSGPRARPVAVLMAAILVATMLGLVYLTQTLGSNAASTEIGLLQEDKAKLIIALDRQALHIETLTDVDAITAAAHEQRLRKLGDPVVLPAP
jgi:hypothetical protein